MKTVICTICPRGCQLHVDESNGYTVTGNGCTRGISYGQSELQHPVRTLTSTVRIEGAAISRISVKTDQPLAKECIPACMKQLNAVIVRAPVRIGDVVVADVLNSGVNVVATKTLERV